MALEGVINGTDFSIQLVNDVIALSTSGSINIEHKLRDISTRESNGYRKQIGGERQWSLEAEGVVAFRKLNGTSYQSITGEASINEIINDHIINRTEVQVKFKPTNPLITGVPLFTGIAFITGASIDAPMEDNTTFSVSLQGTGVLNQLTTGTNQ